MLVIHGTLQSQLVVAVYNLESPLEGPGNSPYFPNSFDRVAILDQQ
jgi:hypothetical protein